MPPSCTTYRGGPSTSVTSRRAGPSSAATTFTVPLTTRTRSSVTGSSKVSFCGSAKCHVDRDGWDDCSDMVLILLVRSRTGSTHATYRVF